MPVLVVIAVLRVDFFSGVLEDLLDLLGREIRVHGQHQGADAGDQGRGAGRPSEAAYRGIVAGLIAARTSPIRGHDAQPSGTAAGRTDPDLIAKVAVVTLSVTAVGSSHGNHVRMDRKTRAGPWGIVDVVAVVSRGEHDHAALAVSTLGGRTINAPLHRRAERVQTGIDAPTAANHVSTVHTGMVKLFANVIIAHGPAPANRHEAALGCNAHHAAAVVIGHCHAGTCCTVIVARSDRRRIHITLAEISLRPDLARRCKVRMANVEAVIDHGHRDVGVPSGDVPCLRRGHVRARSEPKPSKILQMPLIRKQVVRGTVNRQTTQHGQIGFGECDCAGFAQSIGNLQWILRGLAGQSHHKCVRFTGCIGNQFEPMQIQQRIDGLITGARVQFNIDAVSGNHHSVEIARRVIDVTAPGHVRTVLS